jgi:hypothetical protein
LRNPKQYQNSNIQIARDRRRRQIQACVKVSQFQQLVIRSICRFEVQRL